MFISTRRAFSLLCLVLSGTHPDQFCLEIFRADQHFVCSKHIDIRQLSAHVPEPFQNVTAHAVEEELKSRLERYEKLYMSGSISDGESGGYSLAYVALAIVGLKESFFFLASTAEGPHCSFLMFAQLRPSPLSVSNMLEYERELAHPSGANIPHPPVPQFDGVLVSSDCALLIEMRDVEALQYVFLTLIYNIASRNVITTGRTSFGGRPPHVRFLPSNCLSLSAHFPPFNRRIHRIHHLFDDARPYRKPDGVDLKSCFHFETVTLDIRNSSYH